MTSSKRLEMCHFDVRECFLGGMNNPSKWFHEPLWRIVDVNGRWSYFCYLLRSSNKQIIFMCLALRVCFVEWLPQNDRFFIVVSFIAMCRKWKCYVWIGPSLSANPVSKVDNIIWMKVNENIYKHLWCIMLCYRESKPLANNTQPSFFQTKSHSAASAGRFD